MDNLQDFLIIVVIGLSILCVIFIIELTSLRKESDKNEQKLILAVTEHDEHIKTINRLMEKIYSKYEITSNDDIFEYKRFVETLFSSTGCHTVKLKYLPQEVLSVAFPEKIKFNLNDDEQLDRVGFKIAEIRNIHFIFRTAYDESNKILYVDFRSNLLNNRRNQ